jgi:uncharacterized membrane protein YdjX (TVP38/TMEM64 family)
MLDAFEATCTIDNGLADMGLADIIDLKGSPLLEADLEAHLFGTASDDVSELRPHPQRCKKKHKKMCALVFFVVTLLIFGMTNRNYSKQLFTDLLQLCQEFQWASALILAVASAFSTIMMIPCFFLMVSSGVLFTKLYGVYLGPAIASLSIYVGLWIGSILAFHFGRTCLKDSDSDQAREVAKARSWAIRLDLMVREKGLLIVFLARMSPLLPAAFVNYAAAGTSLTLAQYSIGCSGSIVPIGIWTFGAASAFNAVQNDSTDEGLVKKLLFLLLNVAIAAGITIVFHTAYKRTEQDVLCRFSNDELDSQASSEDSAIFE